MPADDVVMGGAGRRPPDGGRRKRQGPHGVGRHRFSAPDLARRGRQTMRHLTGLLAGGFLARVRERRRLGASGLLFRMEVALAAVVRLFVSRDITGLPFPLQLRTRLEMLGPTYVKLGQMLSVRRDLLPDIVIDELAKLLTDLPPAPFEEITAIIEDDLGGSLQDLFQTVDPDVVGSASIAQTHQAVTREGDAVILKVVKPGIRELLYRDSGLLRLWGRLLELIVPRFQPRRIIDEFFEYTLCEVDMVREADNIANFTGYFKDMPDVVFPRVYRQYSGTDVLCMEYMRGLYPDSEEARALPQEQRQRLIDLGAEAIIRMLYQDGFFHADLHPGNVLILDGGRIGFIDLGMVGHLDPELRRSLLIHFHSLVLEDFDTAARHLTAISVLEPSSDVVGFRRAAKQVYRRWRRAASLDEYSLAMMVLESVRLGARFQVYFPMEMVLLVKALVTYEGMGYMLDDGFNVAEVSSRHVGRIMRRQFSPSRLLREGVRTAPDLVDGLTKLPTLVSEGLRLLEREARKRPEPALAGLRATVFGGFCLVSGAILAAFNGPWFLWSILMVLGILLCLRRSP